MAPLLRRRRSALFMPASNPRAIAKARELECDVVILDLEDAVAPEAKPAARIAAAEAVAEGFGTREAVIRVNALDTEWAADDLAASAAARPGAVLVPKLSSVADLAAARAALGPDIALWAMIETPRAILSLPAIADAAPAHGLKLLVAGTNDLAKELRCRPGTDRAPLLPALAQTVLAARAAGIDALDGVSNVIDDPAAVAAECRQGVALGFDGKTLIHPSQVAPANAAWTPAADEVAHARAIVAAFADPAQAGRGAIRVDGRMVELLHLDQARRTLMMAGEPA